MATAAIPAPDSARLRLAEETGRRIVAMVEEDLRPSRIMSKEAFDNAIRVCVAVGGSTNAVVHLLAIARRVGIDLPLDRFDELSRETPLVASLRPSGKFQMEEFREAGGVPAVLRELAPLLNGEAMTVTGRTIAENLAAVLESPRRDIVAPLDAPFASEGGLAILRGNLAPDGAVIKHAAASPQLLRHRGTAIVFNSVDEMSARINDPNLEVSADDVLVLRNAGPIGGPGMPEAGLIPIPAKLLATGVRDMVRISDARMSGTAYGTIVLHVAPEAAAGGPLGAVHDGDEIELDVANRRIELMVSDEEIARRLALRAASPRSDLVRRGYGWMYAKHVLQADQGCDFDFCAADWAG